MEHVMAHDMTTMKGYFHFGFGDQFLFEKFVIDGTVKMWSVCGVLFLLAVLFEYIKYMRYVRCGCQIQKAPCVPEGGDFPDNEIVSSRRDCYVGRLRSRRHRLIQTALHTVQTIIGFLLMLSVMSFNLCIIFAIIVGTSFGYYIFYRPYNDVEAMESCH